MFDLEKMEKFDQLKDLFNCYLCNEILVSPVTIPCGHNVCKIHLYQLFERSSSSEKQSIKCQLCHDFHSLSKNDLTINKQIQSILDTEFYKMKININCFNYIIPVINNYSFVFVYRHFFE